MVKLIELVIDNVEAATAAAQLFDARYEPDTLTEPEPIDSVPENTAVTAPVGVGQPRRVTPAAKVTWGRTAKVASCAVGS